MTRAVTSRLLLVSTLGCSALCLPVSLPAQKPPLDTTAFRAWLEVSSPALSPDGAYAFYTVGNPSISVGDRDPHPVPDRLIVQATRGPWRLELPKLAQARFTADSRRLVGRTAAGDTLLLLMLGSASREAIPDVRAFQLVRQGTTEWLAYQVTTPDGSLVFRDLATGRRHVWPAVTQYAVSPDGNSVVLTTSVAAPGAAAGATAPGAAAAPAASTLRWVRLADGRSTTIWDGGRVGPVVFDSAGTQLTFTVTDTVPGAGGPAIWSYRTGTARAVPLVTHQTPGLEPGWHVGGVSRFSADGRRLLITLQEAALPASPPTAVRVNVWSYLDPKLQSQQLEQLALLGARSYAAVIPLTAPRIIRLEREHERLQHVTDTLAWLTYRQTDHDVGEQHWNRTAQGTSYLVSTRTGARLPAPVNLRYPVPSPDGAYLVGVEEGGGDVFSYELATGQTRNLTQALPIPATLGPMLEREQADWPASRDFRGLSFAAWLADGQALLYDEFDIWQVDPAGRLPPRNVTNGQGRRDRIVFRLVLSNSDAFLAPNATLLVRAFSRVTKQSGFYRIALGRARAPERLVMGPYHYTSILKARDADTYLITRERATESPNYFWTTDFTRFRPVSAVYPERAYNWLTSELHAFMTLDGRTEHGVLYKPENFDSTRQYPVILHYYERKSQELHHYRTPGSQNGALDIPWFVSRGYLVFMPDIHYATGEVGQSAVNSIVGAAQFLATFPWVDTTKLGLQGHSFGGYETNYVVTQTDRFAAAVSSSGPSDLVSGYNGFWMGLESKQVAHEMGQYRMGATLWERPEWYLKNSPIFQLDQVTTPLLTVANRADFNVPFVQGVELFTALRRLGKRAWMLEYDEGRHGLYGKDRVDYIIRMTQFFDHYLKGAPAPRWMTRGIPARMKGLDNGLALDPEIPTPGPGLGVEPRVTAAPHVTATPRVTATPTSSR